MTSFLAPPCPWGPEAAPEPGEKQPFLTPFLASPAESPGPGAEDSEEKFSLFSMMSWSRCILLLLASGSSSSSLMFRSLLAAELEEGEGIG